MRSVRHGRRGRVPGESSYDNTYGDARAFAARMRRRYGRCHAACESAGNTWTRTFRAFEEQGIPIRLANTPRMRIISELV